MTSPPTTSSMAVPAAALNGLPALQVNPMVAAPTARAWSTAPRTKGVRPLADTPTTTSVLPTQSFCTAAAPAVRSSSAPSLGWRMARSPPARHGFDHSCGHVEGRPELGRVEYGEPAGRARTDVDRACPQLQAPEDHLHRGADRRGGGGHRLRRPAGVDRHQGDQLGRAEKVEVVEARPYRLGRQATKVARRSGPVEAKPAGAAGAEKRRRRGPWWDRVVAGWARLAPWWDRVAAKSRLVAKRWGGSRQRLRHQPVDFRLGPRPGRQGDGTGGHCS